MQLCTPSMPITQVKVSQGDHLAWLAFAASLPSPAVGTVLQAVLQLLDNVLGSAGRCHRGRRHRASCLRKVSIGCLAEGPSCPRRFCGSLALACRRAPWEPRTERRGLSAHPTAGCQDQTVVCCCCLPSNTHSQPGDSWSPVRHWCLPVLQATRRNTAYLPQQKGGQMLQNPRLVWVGPLRVT